MESNVRTPDWVKDAIFYHIFADRFARGKSDHDNLSQLRFQSWESQPTLYGFKGGNLWGVIDQLDYLQDLGISAIYFTPIFQSTSYHRYHTYDYYQIDPLLGGRPAFEALLAETRCRKIRVILDGVFNHASRGFFQFNDILENGPDSPWIDWFKIRGWPLSAYDNTHPPNYACWWNNPAIFFLLLH
jgi:glycosidase